jgi:2-oxoglutarate ferredoxin oxidoreductase subunit alpha
VTGFQVAQVHLRHLNPMPNELGDILARYDRVVVPEMNLGSWRCCCAGATSWTPEATPQVRGMPFKAAELADVLRRHLGDIGISQREAQEVSV